MTARGSTFVSIPADALVNELYEIGQACLALPIPDRMVGARADWHVFGHERVYTLLLPGHTDSRPAVRIFTSLAVGADAARDVGEDAIRIVVGVWKTEGTSWFIPTGDSRRIFRTAPRNLPEGERVRAFLTRLRQALREAYAQARAIPVCSECGRLMRERDGRHGRFLGCSGYPGCRRTMAIAGENTGA